MIPADLLAQLPSLGIAGLLFIMWWLERQDRVRTVDGLHDALQYARQLADLNRNLLDIVQTNTAALTTLRDELQAHRTIEREWWERITRELGELQVD